MGHFSAEKTRGDGYWIMDAAAPNDNHYSHAEIVYIISIAPSWHPNISSEPFAAGRPRPQVLAARQPKAACRAGAGFCCYFVRLILYSDSGEYK